MCFTLLTIAGFPIKCDTHPVMALASWTVELSRLRGHAEADATFTPAPPTADLPIRCPAAAQGRVLGQPAHTTHQAEGGRREDRTAVIQLWKLQSSNVLPAVSVLSVRF